MKHDLNYRTSLHSLSCVEIHKRQLLQQWNMYRHCDWFKAAAFSIYLYYVYFHWSLFMSQLFETDQATESKMLY